MPKSDRKPAASCSGSCRISLSSRAESPTTAARGPEAQSAKGGQRPGLVADLVLVEVDDGDERLAGQEAEAAEERLFVLGEVEAAEGRLGVE